MAAPKVVTVVLNTNRCQDTLACLASLSASTYGNHQVVVLDNASTDSSVAAIQAAYPAVRVIGLSENRGYAGNNNAGIRHALALGADWVLVLNEDTLLDRHCLERLVAAGEAGARIGIVGPLVYHHDEPQVIQSAGGRLDRRWQASHAAQNQPDTGQLQGPQTVDWLTGCAILVRRALIDEIGLLDERFYYYWEEVDWCLRARQAGWGLRLVPEAKLWHKGVQRRYRPGANVAYYNTRNRFLLLAKHHASPAAWLCAGWQSLRALASLSFSPRWRGQRQAREAVWQGLIDFGLRRWGARS